MSDAVIAAIARQVAVTASISIYERSPDAKKEFQARLTELCAAVKAERNENYPEVKANQATKGD